MTSHPSWDDIFGPTTLSTPADGADATDPGIAGPAATSRRAMREAQGGGRGRGGRKRRRRNLGWLWAMLVIVALVAGAGVTGWVMFEDKIRAVLGIADPIDYTTVGNGEEVVVIIKSGDIGSDVARELAEKGVTMTFDAFYQLLLASPEVSFQPGNYRLQKEMSAASALAALQDPANKIVNQVTIPEGISAAAALELIASATELPLEELQAEAKDYRQFGIPKKAKGIEGYLFPATYTFDPDVTAVDAIQTLVDEMFSRLDALGVAEGDRFKVLKLASIVQRESGPNVEDMAKIARVFQNRLDRGMNLESDATVAYGTGNTHTVWTTGEERADASNKYNTYANPGLPVGPIGLPGEDAIRAALSPAEGSWLYFVPINLKTGETVFSNSLAEHERNAERLRQWCRASDENAAYCA